MHRPHRKMFRMTKSEYAAWEPLTHLWLTGDWSTLIRRALAEFQGKYADNAASDNGVRQNGHEKKQPPAKPRVEKKQTRAVARGRVKA